MHILDTSSRNVINEVTDISIHERSVGALVASLVCRIDLRQILLLEALVLAFCEAASRSTKQLAISCLDAFCVAILLHVDVKRKRVLRLCHKVLAEVSTCTREGSICFACNFVQTFVEHTRDSILHEVLSDISHRSSHFSGKRIVLEHDGCHHAWELLVLADENERLLVVGHRIVFANGSIGWGWSNVGKHFLQLLLDFVGINVAHDNECLQVGTIPLAVVAAKGFVGKVLHNLHRTDRHAVCILAVLANGGQSCLDESQLCAATSTPLLLDDATLLVYLLVLEQEVVAPVVQDEQTGIDGSCNLDIDVIDVVDGLFERGISVEILAELHADALQILLQGIAREVRCAVEAHVLEEVSQAALVVFLLHRADTLSNVEVTTLLGPFIMADEIGETVVQLACLDSRVKRNRRHLHLLCTNC